MWKVIVNIGIALGIIASIIQIISFIVIINQNKSKSKLHIPNKKDNKVIDGNKYLHKIDWSQILNIVSIFLFSFIIPAGCFFGIWYLSGGTTLGVILALVVFFILLGLGNIVTEYIDDFLK